MSLAATPLAAAPYAAAVHSVALDDFGHCFRRAATGLFTCPIAIAGREALDDRDELRAILRVSRER